MMETQGRSSCPDLMHAAVSVMDAVQNLSTVAQEVVSGSEDEVSRFNVKASDCSHGVQCIHICQQLQSDMPVVIEIALRAAEQVLEAVGRMIEQPQSKDVQTMLVRSSHGVLEGTMKVS